MRNSAPPTDESCPAQMHNITVLHNDSPIEPRGRYFARYLLSGLCSETAVKQEQAQIRNGRAHTTSLTQLQYNRVQDKTRQIISLITTRLYKAVLTATITKQHALTCNTISSPQYNEDAIKGSDVVNLCYCMPLTSNPLTGVENFLKMGYICYLKESIFP